MDAIIFHLNGAVVQPEKLKAQSYAIAALRRGGLPEPGPHAAPGSVLLAAQKPGIDSQDCPMLEDSPGGTQAGVANGVNGVVEEGIVEHNREAH